MRLLATRRGRRSPEPVAGAVLLLVLLLLAGIAAADDQFTEVQREQIIRAFLSEHVFMHRALPRGKAGVRIEEGKISPSEAEMDQQVMHLGAAAKPGERVQITGVRFVRQGILFEINGGPVKRKSWRERVSVGMSTGTGPGSAQPEQSVYTESNGSSVLVVLKDEAAISPDKIKEMLAPVLDFKVMSQAEAYQKSLPPVLSTAVKEHRALVGMDRDMVMLAVGRPLRKLRETSEGKEYEEWIYGTPPQDVQFVRFVGGKVVRIEEMKVTGEKRVRTENEVGDLSGVLDASAQKQGKPGAMAAPAEEERRKPPTLLRPGEKIDDHGTGATQPAPAPTSPPAN